jgi:hypothetical protein
MTHCVKCGPAFDLDCAKPAVTRVLLAMLLVRAGAWRQPYPRFRLAATKSARASDGPARRYHAYQRGSHGKDRFHARAAAVMPKLALSYAIKRSGHRVDASLRRGPFLAGQYLAPAEDRSLTGDIPAARSASARLTQGGHPLSPRGIIAPFDHAVKHLGADLPQRNRCPVCVSGSQIGQTKSLATVAPVGCAEEGKKRRVLSDW